MKKFSSLLKIILTFSTGSLCTILQASPILPQFDQRSVGVPVSAKTKKLIASYTCEWTTWNPDDSFSTDLPKTAMLGNGDIGIVSAGNGLGKTYLISKSDFWSCGNLEGVCFGDENQKTKPLPIGGVTIRSVSETDSAKKQDCFYEKLDILHACLETEFTQSNGKLQMKARMIASENLLAIELKSSQEMDLEIDVWTKQDNPLFPVSTINEGNLMAVSRRTYNNASENQDSWISEAILSPKIIEDKTTGCWKEKIPGRISRTVRLAPEHPAWLVIAVGGGGQTYDYAGKLKGKDPQQTARELLNSANTPADIQALLKSHAEWWTNYWSASSIDLDKSDESIATVERYYYGARYLMGAGIRPGKTAPGLYGIWHTTDTPKWSSDYHLNYNFISAFYGAASGNLCGMLLPAVDAMLDAEKEGMKRAADPNELKRINHDYVSNRPELQNGIPGAVLYPVGIGPWGSTPDDSYHNELLNAAYSSWPIIQYYEYTRDRAFLEKTYGFLKKCARLYETWLERKDNGELLLIAGYNEGSWSQNPAIELGTIKMLLSFLVRASETLDQDEEKRIVWTDILEHLPDQPVSEWKGRRVFALAEREWKDNAWKPLENPIASGGNIVPLDTILPGGLMGYYSSPAEHEIAKNTIEAFGNGVWEQFNNFPRIFYDAVQMRYPPDKLLNRMAGIVNKQMGNNLVIRDGYHGMEKAGATAAIDSMLVLSHHGIVKIFPNWPKDKNASFVRLRVPGGFLVSASYNSCQKEITKLEITSLIGGKLTVAHPWKNGPVTVTGSKGPLDVHQGISDPEWKEQTLTIPQTQAGETYSFHHHKNS